MTMDEIDRLLQDLDKRADRVLHRIQRAKTPADDDALIRMIQDGAATPSDVARLARILAPAVRSQLVRCALSRSEVEIKGEKLPFTPSMPMELAVELCSYPTDEKLPDDVQRSFNFSLEYAPDSWRRIEKVDNRWMAHTMYLRWVEATVLLAAGGSWDFLSVRQSVDRWFADGSTEEFVFANGRVFRLAKALRGPDDYCCYSLVLHESMAPFLMPLQGSPVEASGVPTPGQT